MRKQLLRVVRRHQLVHALPRAQPDRGQRAVREPRRADRRVQRGRRRADGQQLRDANQRRPGQDRGRRRPERPAGAVGGHEFGEHVQRGDARRDGGHDNGVPMLHDVIVHVLSHPAAGQHGQRERHVDHAEQHPRCRGNRARGERRQPPSRPREFTRHLHQLGGREQHPHARVARLQRHHDELWERGHEHVQHIRRRDAVRKRCARQHYLHGVHLALHRPAEVREQHAGTQAVRSWQRL